MNHTALEYWFALFPFLKEDLPDWRLTPPGNVKTYLEATLEPVPIYISIVVFGCLGVCGNLMLCLLSRHREIRPLSYSLYVTAICVTDTAHMCVTYTSFLMRLNKVRLFHNVTDLGLCRFLYLLTSFFRMVSPWIRILSSFDCFIRVVFPRAKQLLCRKVVARISLVFVVLLCAGLQLPFALAVGGLYFRGQDICALHDMDYVDLLPVMNVVELLGPCGFLLLLNGPTFFVALFMTKCRGTIDNNDNSFMADERQTTKALVVCNLITSIVLAPSAVVTSLLLDELPKNLVVTDYEQTLADATPYTSMLYCVSLASNLYLMLAASKLYRSVARGSLSMCAR